MAEVIELGTKIVSLSPELKNPVSVRLLQDFNKNPDVFEELIICFKKTNGSTGIIDTMPSIEDKSLFLQMLQHQITSYLDRTSTIINPHEVAALADESEDI